MTSLFSSRSLNGVSSLVVAKFGGTSMGDAEAMRKGAEIVRGNPRIRLVVVSATSATTNQLLDIYKCATELPDADSAARAAQKLQRIEDRHSLIARNLGCSSENGHATFGELHQLYREMRETVTRFEEKSAEQGILLDQLLSIGERLSSILFTFALNQIEIHAKSFDIRQVLATDNHFGKAEPNIPEIARRSEEILRPWIAAHDVTVTQGFIGSTSDERKLTTTLGRGGSDYSAALLAESLIADELQIWTDVPGIMTMDPRAVKTARVIPQMSFAEAAELANFGAKVLHPATLWPAIRRKIRVFVGSTFDPTAGGTWIYAEGLDQLSVRAIALRKNQTLITITSLRMLNAHGFLARLFEILARYGMSVDLVTTSEVSVALTVDGASLGTGTDFEDDLASPYAKMLGELRSFSDVKIERDLTLVAIVGNGLNTTAGVGSRAFSAISQFNVRLICQGASSHNLCFLVNQSEALEIANRLHQELIN